jgi:hypothetical protein
MVFSQIEDLGRSISVPLLPLTPPPLSLLLAFLIGSKNIRCQSEQRKAAGKDGLTQKLAAPKELTGRHYDSPVVSSLHFRASNTTTYLPISHYYM